MWTFNFNFKARFCKKCNTNMQVVLVQLTNGTQAQKCKRCNAYV